MTTRDPYAITDREQLRAIVGEPGPRAALKTIDRIDRYCARFIAAAPFVVLATRGADGLLDLSPKGDPAGFVAVLDERTLAIPDRLGNNRFDSYENLLLDPSVGLIFLIPGHNDTLRVAGEGRITRDPDLLGRFVVHGKSPRFVLVVTVREAFLHCAKGMGRSGLWRPEAWPDTADAPTLAEAMVAHGRPRDSADEMQAIIDADRANRLY